MDSRELRRLIDLDHAHLWHPFTPMRQWRQADPIVIERGEGDELIDPAGRRYIDGVSSLWCNVHGHRVPEIDQAIRDQLDRIAHSTLLGLSNIPAIELAAKLCAIAPAGLSRCFLSDSGATATEAAFKMAVGHWFHQGQPQRHTFIALAGGYHGDTAGAMSVGYSDLFHRPFRSMVFRTRFVPPPDPSRGYRRAVGGPWALQDADHCRRIVGDALAAMERALGEEGERVAAVVVEPRVQGAAGMIVQPPGYLRGVAELCRRFGVLLIADEVATGFGRTGAMFACEHESVQPDILCLGKGLSGGYLPVAATLCTEQVEQSFCGEPHEFKTLYHGHTFGGNPLGCAASLASLQLFESSQLLAEVRRKAALLNTMLQPLRDLPVVKDVRYAGLMFGVELDPGDRSPEAPEAPDASQTSGQARQQGDFGESIHRHARRPGHEVCQACRADGVLIRPLGNVVVLMPPLSITDDHLERLAASVVKRVGLLN
jgi:adenosylmethionine-8-amino-7-oxononanoate aminotransferase